MTEEQKQGLSRREVLKKGAMLGGTVLWVVPVVQAVGMSPAMAQVPSETSCCLKIVDLTAQGVAGDGGSNDVSINITVQNCGTHSTDFDVYVELQRLQVISGTPDPTTAVGLANIPFLDLAPAEQKGPNSVNDFDLADGVYVYRGHGTYHCPSRNSVPALDHNVPSSYWVYSGQVTIPTP
jgi:hypothetical protein